VQYPSSQDPPCHPTATTRHIEKGQEQGKRYRNEGSSVSNAVCSISEASWGAVPFSPKVSLVSNTQTDTRGVRQGHKKGAEHLILAHCSQAGRAA
jgi:hypothetical protein